MPKSIELWNGVFQDDYLWVWKDKGTTGKQCFNREIPRHDMMIIGIGAEGMTKTWKDQFDKRELNEIEYCITYKQHFNHGTLGHNLRIVIAKMANLLDMAEMVIHEKLEDNPLEPIPMVIHGRLEAKAERDKLELELQLGRERESTRFQRIFSQIGTIEELIEAE